MALHKHKVIKRNGKLILKRKKKVASRPNNPNVSLSTIASRLKDETAV